MEDIIRQLAAYAGADDPQALAQEISMVMEGAYVTCHVAGNRGVADIGRRILRMLIDERLPRSQ